MCLLLIGCNDLGVFGLSNERFGFFVALIATKNKKKRMKEREQDLETCLCYVKRFDRWLKYLKQMHLKDVHVDIILTSLRSRESSFANGNGF